VTDQFLDGFLVGYLVGVLFMAAASRGARVAQ
jgi:hypothetical protein